MWTMCGSYRHYLALLVDSTAIGMSWEELLHKSYLALQTVRVRPVLHVGKQILLFNALFGPLFGFMKANFQCMYNGKRLKEKIAGGCLIDITLTSCEISAKCLLSDSSIIGSGQAAWRELTASLATVPINQEHWLSTAG